MGRPPASEAGLRPRLRAGLQLGPVWLQLPEAEPGRLLVLVSVEMGWPTEWPGTGMDCWGLEQSGSEVSSLTEDRTLPSFRSDVLKGCVEPLG